MARGKWRERMRGVRNRLLGRQDSPPLEDELTPSVPASPIPIPARPAKPSVMKMGPNQLSYYIPPELQNNLRHDRETSTSIFDFTRPLPASETPSRPKRRLRSRSRSSSSASSPSPTARCTSERQQQAKSSPTVRFATPQSGKSQHNGKHRNRSRGRPEIPLTPVDTPESRPPSPSPPST